VSAVIACTYFPLLTVTDLSSPGASPSSLGGMATWVRVRAWRLSSRKGVGRLWSRSADRFALASMDSSKKTWSWSFPGGLGFGVWGLGLRAEGLSVNGFIKEDVVAVVSWQFGVSGLGLRVEVVSWRFGKEVEG